MCDEGLSEILGFDPESDERHEDRGNLRAGPKSDEHGTIIVPEEVQQKFAAFFAKRETARIVPQALFKAEPDRRGNVLRNYYAYDPKMEHNPNFPFQGTGVALFTKRGDEYAPSTIEWRGETRGDAIFLHLAGHVAGDNVQMISWLQGRKFDVWYDEFGVMRSLWFSQGEIDDEDTSELHLNDPDVAQLPREGFTYEDGDDVYHVVRDDENDKLILTRKQGDTTYDTVSIPLHVDRQQIVEQLFPEVLLKRPLEMPPGPDIDQWRYVDPIKNVLGIDWSREA